MRPKSVLRKPTPRSRLQHERRLRGRDVPDDRLAPASMVWDLENIAAKIDLASRVHGSKPCCRLGLDVA